MVEMLKNSSKPQHLCMCRSVLFQTVKHLYSSRLMGLHQIPGRTFIKQLKPLHYACTPCHIPCHISSTVLSKVGVSVLEAHTGRRLPKRGLEGLWLWFQASEHRAEVLQPIAVASGLNHSWIREKKPDGKVLTIVQQEWLVDQRALTGEMRLKDFNIYHLSELWLGQRGKWLMNTHWLWPSQTARTHGRLLDKKMWLMRNQKRGLRGVKGGFTDPC